MTGLTACWFCLASALLTPPAAQQLTPAPLYRDPLFDGAADPVVVWNPQRQAWWMVYTQRCAKLDVPGVQWCHGTEMGVAESRDKGVTWNYVGQLPLDAPDEGHSFWAPDIIRADDGTYHLFVSYIPGPAAEHVHWNGDAYIFQYSSSDLWNWKFTQRIQTGHDRCIDPSLFHRPDGTWRMWYKDEDLGAATVALDSQDLRNWTPVDDPGVSQRYGEGPKIFEFGGHYWLLKDPNTGLDVYRSSDLTEWTYQGKILEQPGQRNDDVAIGKHPDVVVSGERAYIIYFTHPYGQDYPDKQGHMQLCAKCSSIQAAELQVIQGRLVCDRNRDFLIQLEPPRQP